MEGVMGKIEDEFEDATDEVEYLEDGTYKVDGGLPIFDFNERFHTHLESDVADTIGGYLISKEGLMPEEMVGKKCKVQGFTFEVTEALERRVISVNVRKVTSQSIDS